ncbi:uncharacterized protein LOC105096958 isoform X1 [Camelus dromedarius]|uniref:uncharacterized protein LOC105096958 isoform X1 n=1 Tax=Camelus dromedarius TaxID=9838 RepID=UPI00311A0C3E
MMVIAGSRSNTCRWWIPGWQHGAPAALYSFPVESQETRNGPRASSRVLEKSMNWDHLGTPLAGCSQLRLRAHLLASPRPHRALGRGLERAPRRDFREMWSRRPASAPPCARASAAGPSGSAARLGLVGSVKQRLVKAPWRPACPRLPGLWRYKSGSAEIGCEDFWHVTQSSLLLVPYSALFGIFWP